MVDKIIFDDPFYPVPPEIADADPKQAIRCLLARNADLEKRLEEQQQQAVEQLRQVMLDLLGLYDQVTQVIEERGVATNAQDAVMVRAMIALGRQMLTALRHHHVEAIGAIGKTVDPATSDVVGYEPRDNVRPDVVLREARIGYAWPHGVLRRAAVIVSKRDEAAAARDGGTNSQVASSDAG